MTKIHKRSFSDKLRIIPSIDDRGRFRADLYWASNNKKIGHVSADTQNELDNLIGRLLDDYHRFSQPGAIPEDQR